MRLAILSDLHLGPDRGGKLGSFAGETLQAFLEATERSAADRIVELGDRINEVDAETDAANLGRVAEAFRRAGAPRTHLLGNHDLHHLSRDQNARLLNVSMRSEATELGTAGGARWRLLAFRPDATYVPRHGRLRMREEDLAWLQAALAEDPNAATIVASHVPLLRVPLEGNPYFAARPHTRAWHENVDAATEILARHPQVVACLHGHTHQPDVTVFDGIPFLTAPSPTEAFGTDPDPGRGWATLDLGTELRFEVHGLAPWSWSAPVRLPRRRWSAAARAAQEPR